MIATLIITIITNHYFHLSSIINIITIITIIIFISTIIIGLTHLDLRSMQIASVAKPKSHKLRVEKLTTLVTNEYLRLKEIEDIGIYVIDQERCVVLYIYVYNQLHHHHHHVHHYHYFQSCSSSSCLSLYSSSS